MDAPKSAEQRFRAECLPAHRKLRKELANVSISGKEARHDLAGKDYVLAMQYRRLGESLSYSVEEPRAAGIPGPGRVTVYSVNPVRYFKLSKNAGSERFLIDLVDRTTAKNLEDSQMKGQLEGRLLPMINAPYDLEKKPFDAIMEDPAFRLHAARGVEVGGRPLVEVEVSCEGQGDHQINSAKVQLDPGLSWAIRKFELKSRNPLFGVDVEQSGFIEYADDPGGRVVPRRIFQKNAILFPNRKQPFESRDLAIDHFSTGSLSPDRFELPAFGLPDLPTEPERAANWFSLHGWFFWAMVSVSIASFACLRFLRRRA